MGDLSPGQLFYTLHGKTASWVPRNIIAAGSQRKLGGQSIEVVAQNVKSDMQSKVRNLSKSFRVKEIRNRETGIFKMYRNR
jgi:hypothetical protein